MEVETAITNCTTLRCFFLSVAKDPPLANPFAIVLMVPLRGDLDYGGCLPTVVGGSRLLRLLSLSCLR